MKISVSSFIRLLICTILFVQQVCAQVGNPFIRNVPPTAYQSDSYNSSPQNWCINQDSRGIIYLSNQDNTLAWNGKKWRTVEGTAGRLFYKTAKDNAGVLYTGGLGDLGFFTCDSLGKNSFISLLPELKGEARLFEKIFNIVSDAGGRIFFMDKTWLFVWDGKKMQAFKSTTAYRRAMVYAGRVYIQQKDNGISMFTADRFETVPGSFRLNTLQVKGISRVNETDTSLLVITYEQGLYRFSEHVLNKIPSPLDTIKVWNTCELADGTIALATAGHGLCILNKKTTAVEQINEQHGLYFNATVFPAADAEAGTWVASGIGASRVEYPAQIRSLNTTRKSKTQAFAMALYDNKLFTGMNDGGWILDLNPGNPVFKKIPGVNDLTRSIIYFDDKLLIASGQNGVFLFDRQEKKQVFSGSATALLRSSADPGRVWIGTENGLTSISWNGTAWQEGTPVEGFNHPVYDIAELPDGTVWAGFTTMSRVTFKNNAPGKPAVTTFDSAQGFTADHGDYDLFMHAGKLYFGTGRGIFHFDDTKQKLVPDATFGERFADRGNGAHAMVHDLYGNIWLYDSKRTGVLRKDSRGSWQWNDLPLRRMDDQVVWSIYPAPDSLIWIGTNTTLYSYDTRITKNYHVPFNALIDQVTVNDSDVVFYGNYAGPDGLLTLRQPDRYKPVLAWAQNKISFSYTATSYEYPEKTSYSYWLEGLDAGWSQWTPESNKNFNNLHEGTYTFHVRARNLFDTVSEEAAYTFTIMPPWYRTWWAYLAWGLAGAGLLLLLVRWQVRRANRKKNSEREAERKQQHIRLEATVEAQEKERSRIAKDLHDDIQVTLASAKMKMNMMRNLLKKQGLDASLTAEPVELVQDAIESVRNISKDLMPVTLERLGLVTALRELFSKTDQGEELHTTAEVTGTVYRLAFSRELAVYRVCQELLANSLKHADATVISLHLHFEEAALVVTYTDNGKGFDTTKQAVNSSGLGFRNMEIRISLASGTFIYESVPGQGCRFVITLPSTST